VRSIIRIHLGYPSNFSFGLSSRQEGCLKRLIHVLGDSTVSSRRRMLAYHEMVWSLVDVEEADCHGRWNNVIQRAIWLKALREDGNFYRASDFTPDLAKLKYMCNMTALLEALFDKDKDSDSAHGDDIK